jgi:hypothetical protein
MDENVFEIVVSFYPDGKFIVCASGDGAVEPTEKNTAHLENDDDTPCTCASIFPGKFGV